MRALGGGGKSGGIISIGFGVTCNAMQFCAINVSRGLICIRSSSKIRLACLEASNRGQGPSQGRCPSQAHAQSRVWARPKRKRFKVVFGTELDRIEKLEKLIELRTQEREDTIQKIDETKTYMKDITDERKAENEAYLQAKKDDEAAKGLLEDAKAAFSEYLKKNDIKTGPIQGGVNDALLQEPEFTRSADDAPDASFGGKGNNKLKSKGIISLFDYIIEDLADELANEKKAEAKSQSEYEAELATAQKLLNDLKAKKVTLEGIIAKREEDKEEENKDMKENNKDRDAELAYQGKITPDCDWIIKAFDGRADARAAEMNGLTTAKEFLAGKQTSIYARIMWILNPEPQTESLTSNINIPKQPLAKFQRRRISSIG